MTILEFCGCGMITFCPPLAIFSFYVAPDPIKVILFIAAAFFWLLSFLAGTICWTVVSYFCDYLIIGAYLAVIFQEIFRYLYHIALIRAHTFLTEIISSNNGSNTNLNEENVSKSSKIVPLPRNSNSAIHFGSGTEFGCVSGIGFGLMNAACLMSNILTDSIGPGTVGLTKGSQYFLLVSSFTGLAFILLNVAWSVLVSESVKQTDRKLLIIVIVTHLIATSTFDGSLWLWSFPIIRNGAKVNLGFVPEAQK